LFGKSEQKRPLGRPCVDERILLKLILQRQGVNWINVAGSCEYGNETLTFVISCKNV
jgi:hypothetical protein